MPTTGYKIGKILEEKGIDNNSLLRFSAFFYFKI